MVESHDSDRISALLELGFTADRIVRAIARLNENLRPSDRSLMRWFSSVLRGDQNPEAEAAWGAGSSFLPPREKLVKAAELSDSDFENGYKLAVWIADRLDQIAEGESLAADDRARLATLLAAISEASLHQTTEYSMHSHGEPAARS